MYEDEWMDVYGKTSEVFLTSEVCQMNKGVLVLQVF